MALKALNKLRVNGLGHYLSWISKVSISKSMLRKRTARVAKVLM
jgi:hypothetical protein